MERDMLTCALLFDTYGEMLTEKQRLCCDLRYNQDLSLGEIGELEGISRQAVRDNLVRAESQMQEMEEKIGAVRRMLQIEAATEQLQAAAELARKRDEREILLHIECAMKQMEEGNQWPLKD